MIKTIKSILLELNKINLTLRDIRNSKNQNIKNTSPAKPLDEETLALIGREINTSIIPLKKNEGSKFLCSNGKKILKCKCGKNQHREEAVYCSNCGEKLNVDMNVEGRLYSLYCLALASKHIHFWNRWTVLQLYAKYHYVLFFNRIFTVMCVGSVASFTM